jgi:hypothetical protein
MSDPKETGGEPQAGVPAPGAGVDGSASSATSASSSNDGDAMGGVRGAAAGNRTMTIDAIADPDAVLEDASTDDDGAGAPVVAPLALASARPPPLPPKAPSKGKVLVAVSVTTVLAVGLAFGLSRVLFKSGPAAAPPSASPASSPRTGSRQPVVLEEFHLGGADDPAAEVASGAAQAADSADGGAPAP